MSAWFTIGGLAEVVYPHGGIVKDEKNMSSKREIAFKKYWQGKEDRKIDLDTVRFAYEAGWSDSVSENHERTATLSTPTSQP